MEFYPQCIFLNIAFSGLLYGQNNLRTVGNKNMISTLSFLYRYKMYSRNTNVPQDHCSFEISTYNLFEGRKDKNVHSEDWGTYSPKNNLLLFARLCEMSISQSSGKGFMIVNRLPDSPGL